MLNVAFFSGPEPQRIESCLGCIKDVDFVTVALSGGLAPALRRRLRGGMRPDVVLIGGGIAPQEVPQAVHVLRAEAPKVAVVVVTDRTGLHALEEVPKGALTAVIASEELDRLAGILRYAARPRVRERAEQKDFAFFEARRPVGGVYVKDTGLRYVYADTTYAARLGQQPESLLGKTDEELACEADLAGASAEERRVVESGEPLERIESIALEDGGPVEARLIRAPVRDDEGQVCGVLGRWDRADELGEELRRFPSSFRLTIGAGGAMLSWPPEAEKLFWRDATEALGWSAGLLVSPVDRAYLRERLRECGTSGRAEAGDLTLVRSDGLWMKADMQLRFIGCGGAGAGATAAEGTITFWPPPEPEYPPGFESPEHVLDPIPDLTYRFDVRNGTFDYVSRWVDCLLGYHREELVQMGMAGMEQRLEPADRRRVREATRRLLRDRTASGPTRLDYSFQAKDGSNVGLVEDRYVLRARDGRPQCLVGAIRREGSDRVLRVSDTARSLPRVALETLTFKDCDLNLVWTWDVAAPPHGLAPERAVGLSDLELVPRHLARVWQAEDRAFLETVEDVPYMVSAMHYRALWMDVREQRKIGVFDSKGRPAGLLVTRTRVKQQDLDALSAYWTAVAVSTPDAVIGLDHAGRIAAWNPGAEALYGYSAEEIRGTRLDYIWRDPDSDVSSYLRRLAAGEIIRGEEAAHRAADGHWFPVSLSMSPVKAQEDIVMGYAIVAHDMAGTHEARQSLQQSEERLRRLVETVSDGISICEWEPDEGRLSLWLCNDRYV
ncbi:MAG: PAS domain S-box protein [Candidatus Brocadiia bacterium]